MYEIKNAQVGWADSLNSGRTGIQIPPGALVSGGTIDMRGGKPLVLPNGNEHSRNLQEEQRKLQTGNKSVLAVRIILNDAAYDYATQTGLSNDIFGNGVDPTNLVSQYKACSYDQLIFTKSQDRAMSSNPNDGTTAISNGVVDIKVDLNFGSRIDGNVNNAVTSKINEVFGVSSPRQLADHVMYCQPSGTMGGIAYAYINSWLSVYSNEWCNYVSGQMHEVSTSWVFYEKQLQNSAEVTKSHHPFPQKIGHNLNWAHVSTCKSPWTVEVPLMSSYS